MRHSSRDDHDFFQAILEKNAHPVVAAPEELAAAQTPSAAGGGGPAPFSPLGAGGSGLPFSPSAAASFPPGLLAANPSLANAAPGSLVVVGGGGGESEGGEGGPNQQLLHVFRITEEDGHSGQDNYPPTVGHI